MEISFPHRSLPSKHLVTLFSFIRPKDVAEDEASGDQTFLTQAAMDGAADRAGETSLPQIAGASTALVEVGAPLQVA